MMNNQNGQFRIWLVLKLILSMSFFPSLASAQEFLDPPDNSQVTVRSNMHACPTGSFIRGLDVAQNILLCGPPPSSGAVIGAEFVDGDDEPPATISIGGTTMHRCPPRTALTGIHVRRNDFLCQGYIPNGFGEDERHNLPTRTNLTYPWWCPGTFACNWAATVEIINNVRQGVRACDQDQVVIGVHAARMEFACGYVLSPLGED